MRWATIFRLLRRLLETEPSGDHGDDSPTQCQTVFVNQRTERALAFAKNRGAARQFLTESTGIKAGENSASPFRLKFLFPPSEPFVGSRMHSLRPFGEKVVDTAGRAESLSDLDGSGRSSREGRLVLRVILQSMAKSTPEAGATIKDPATSVARQTPKPLAGAAEMKRHIDERHDLVDADPLVVLAMAVNQTKSMLEVLDSDRAGFVAAT